MSIREMIETHPRPTALDRDALAHCIDACFVCVTTCTSCADACLAEETVQELVRSIRLDLDCADICGATGRVLSRQTSTELSLVQSAVAVCADACRLCAEECERHAKHHEHCRVCAEVCRRCEQACTDLLSTIG